MIAKEDDYINPTTYGKLNWDHDSSCTSYSEEGAKNWQNGLHEVSTNYCARMTKVAHCMPSEGHNLHYYDGFGNLDTFLTDYKEQVPENQRFSALDITLRATHARWWGTHKKNIGDWEVCRRLMWIRF